MGRSDYIPRRDDLFDPWFRVLRDYVIGKTSGANPEWAHIPPAAGHLSPAPFPRTAFLHPCAEPLCAQTPAVFPHSPLPLSGGFPGTRVNLPATRSRGENPPGGPRSPLSLLAPRRLPAPSRGVREASPRGGGAFPRCFLAPPRSPALSRRRVRVCLRPAADGLRGGVCGSRDRTCGPRSVQYSPWDKDWNPRFRDFNPWSRDYRPRSRDCNPRDRDCNPHDKDFNP
jgi:hypothetical protein